LVLTITKMTIGCAAREAGVGVETIRFYERKGLIRQPLKPTDGGYRSYPDETVEKIRFIRKGQELGFSLREIQDLLSIQADPAADSSVVRSKAVSKLEEVQNKIAQLIHIRETLESIIATCPGSGSTACCSILDAMSQGKR
jgi:MerR family transcriptional regulator, copper efflux regulator